MNEPNIIEMSVVVVAEHHNPSILHPAFLKHEKIMPPDLETNSEQSFTTPQVSAVSFTNGIRMVIEPNRLQVVDSQSESGGRETFLQELCKKYVEILPHVNYKAVGVNITAFHVKKGADQFMIEHFMKERSWDLTESRAKLRTASCKLIYAMEDFQIGYEFSAGRPDKKNEEDSRTEEVILIKANFHADIDASTSADRCHRCVEIIDRICRYKAFFIEMTPQLLLLD